MLNIVYLSRYWLFYIFIILELSSCTRIPSLDDRRDLAVRLAGTRNMEVKLIGTNDFNLATFYRINNHKKPLNIYIEGDGYAWKNSYTPSSNPTPIRPIALEMAINDPRPNILYIARPCQYTDFTLEDNCQEKFWTDSRFSSQVIDSVNQTIDWFMLRFELSSINIYGYSGGAAVAVIVGAKRDDIKSIKTVAGNLNHQLLSQIHLSSPLKGSLNPMDFVENIKNIPQLHLAGGRDLVIPPCVIESFVNKVKASGGRARIKLIDDADHEYKKWPEIWSENLN